MKGKINYKYIFVIIISLIISSVFEFVIFQYNSIKGGNQYKDVSVIDYKYFNKEKDYYKSNPEKKSEIVLNLKNNYVYEFQFNYKSDYDFKWDMEVLLKDGEVKKYNYTSASILNTVNKKINSNVNKIKIITKSNVIMSDFKINNKNNYNFIRFLTVFIGSILAIYILLKRKALFNNLARTFVILVIPIGTLIILLTPISAFTSADDQVHFHNIYTLLDGDYSKWSDSGRYFDKLVLDAPFRFSTNEEYQDYIDYLNNNNRNYVKKYNSNSIISYNRLTYLPEAVIMKLCRIINVSFSNMIYISKVFNYLIYVLLLYFAIKVIPICKKTVFSFAVLPTTIYIATQFTYDTIITGTMVLGICYYIKMLNDTKIDMKDLFKFCLFVTIACLAKMIYCPVILLILFLDKKKFSDSKFKTKINFSIVILFFTLLFSFALPAILSPGTGDSRISGTSDSSQMSYVLHNPINFIKIFIIYTINNVSDYLFGFGTLSKMGYIVQKTDGYFRLPIFVTLATLLYVTFTDGADKKVITNKIKIIFSILLAGLWSLIAFALYSSWTPVGAQYIAGVQGRYFLPVLLLVLFILKPTTDKKKIEENNNWLIILFPILILLFYMLYIIKMFYL